MAELSGFAGSGRAETLERIAQRGIFAGFLASAVMGLLAMAASATYQARGFFTPAYHVAFIIDPNTMGASLAKAGAGERFYFSREAFVFGLAAHVIVAGIFGAIFALGARRLRLHGTKALAGGLAYGLAIMVVMSALVLPVAASMSGAGEPISRMGSEFGWPTFAAVHAFFGLALGSWIYVRPQDLEG
jgi:uncharacterized membrane protein YagU involved in acid resistance